MLVLGAAAGVGALLVMPNRRSGHASDSADFAEEPEATHRLTAATRSGDSNVPIVQKKLPDHVRVDPNAARFCVTNMQLVDGVHCAYVGHRCERFVEEKKEICATYSADVICEGGLHRRRFCIDVYEYPNIVGARPAVWMSFEDAKRACAVEGKRLCSAEEWELACEGTSMWPHPYGRTAEIGACNVPLGASAAGPNEANLGDPWKRTSEIARSDGRLVAGHMPTCVSSFGVADMTGNVEEWVTFANGNERQKPFNVARKGGSWLRGKGRCRPIDASEPRWYRASDLGFRCCTDAK